MIVDVTAGWFMVKATDKVVRSVPQRRHPDPGSAQYSHLRRSRLTTDGDANAAISG
ncbi:hypothetical protein ACFOJ6_08715 [Gordonia humi]|uniref:hypothetical protein n=1 Tax=Gordonia humi TaxID=686429 RepID=UPI00360C6DA6